MSFIGKVQRMKHYLEENGLRFPTEVNQGSRTNRQSKFYPLISSYSSLSRIDNVFRSRMVLRVAQQALRANNLEEASEALAEMMTLLALQRIRQPLVELDLAAHLISTNIKVISSMTFNVRIPLLFFRSSSCKARPKPRGRPSYGPP